MDQGRPVGAPEKITRDDAGARRLAELYAFPAEGVHVRAMMNASIDGAIAGADGTSATLRNPDDSFAFSVLRALADVILTGAATARVEDCARPRGRASLRFPSRRPGGAERPALAICTRTGELPDSLEPDWPTWLICPPESVETVRGRSGFPPEQVIPAADAPGIIEALTRRGYRGIQCEGGPSLLTDLTAHGLVDELCLSVSHRVIGGDSPRVMSGEALDQRWELRSLIVGETATLTRYQRP